MAAASAEKMGPGFYAALAYLATTWVCVWLLQHVLVDANAWLRALVGLLPIIPISFLVHAIVRRMLAGDELQRRIDLQAIAVSSMLVGLGALTLSLLIIAGVLQLSGRQALQWVLPALVMGYGIAKLWVARRY